MENELQPQVFKHELFGEVRVIYLNGDPWFVGKEVATIVGYSNSSKAIKDHVDDEDKLNNESLSSLGQRGGWLINESGLYSLILSSKLTKAKKFKRWVTSEVLPTIRKTGGYVHDSEFFVDSYFPDADPSMKIVLTKALDDKKRLLEENEQQKNRLDLLTHTDKTYTATEIAKELGMKSPRELNLKLAEKHIQYKVNGTWVLYNEYADRGYTEIKQSSNANNVYYNRHFTQSGREFILGLFNEL